MLALWWEKTGLLAFFPPVSPSIFILANKLSSFKKAGFASRQHVCLKINNQFLPWKEEGISFEETSRTVTQSTIEHAPADTKQDVQGKLTDAWQNFWEEWFQTRILYNVIPDVAGRMELDVEITGGILHFIMGHGTLKQKLKDMNIAEDNHIAPMGRSLPQNT